MAYTCSCGNTEFNEEEDYVPVADQIIRDWTCTSCGKKYKATFDRTNVEEI